MPAAAISCGGCRLDDRAFLHHADEVGVLHRRQPVRDDEGGAVLGELRQAPLHQPLRFGVERARRLVEQQDRRVLEDRARERQALALAAREPQAAVADLGVVALGLGDDESWAAAALAAATIAACGAPSRPSAMLAPIVSSNSVTSWVTIEMASRSEASVTSRTSWPSMRMRPRSRRTAAARG